MKATKGALNNPSAKIKQQGMGIMCELLRYSRDDAKVLQAEILADIKDNQALTLKNVIAEIPGKRRPNAFHFFEQRDMKESTLDVQKNPLIPENIPDIPYIKKAEDKREALTKLCNAINMNLQVPVEQTMRTLITLVEDANYLLFSPSLTALSALLSRPKIYVPAVLLRKAVTSASGKFNSKNALKEEVLGLISNAFKLDGDIEGFLRMLLNEAKFGKGASRLCALEWLGKRLPGVAVDKFGKYPKCDVESFTNTLKSLLAGKFEYFVDLTSNTFLICAFIYDQLMRFQREETKTHLQNDYVNSMAQLTQNFLVEVESATGSKKQMEPPAPAPRTKSVARKSQLTDRVTPSKSSKNLNEDPRNNASSKADDISPDEPVSLTKKSSKEDIQSRLQAINAK